MESVRAAGRRIYFAAGRFRETSISDFSYDLMHCFAIVLQLITPCWPLIFLSYVHSFRKGPVVFKPKEISPMS